MKARIVFFSLLLTVFSTAFCQNLDFSQHIIIDVWGELDAYPESESAADIDSPVFAFPVSRVKEVSRYMLNGMLYGWNFEYTPYDKTRRVAEYFETSFINTENFEENQINFKAPKVIENKMHAWAEYYRTEQQIWTFRQWKSISTKSIQGRGKGKVSDGFDGIIAATDDAIKNAVREYYRSIIKNKPKEIDGRVIIAKEPRIGIVEGQYIVELDFFLETDRIVKYTQY